MEHSDDQIIYDTMPISIWNYFLREGILRDLSDPHRFSGDLHIIYEGQYVQNEKKKKGENNDESQGHMSNSGFSSQHQKSNHGIESTSWNDYSVRICFCLLPFQQNYCFHCSRYDC